MVEKSTQNQKKYTEVCKKATWQHIDKIMTGWYKGCIERSNEPMRYTIIHFLYLNILGLSKVKQQVNC